MELIAIVLSGHQLFASCASGKQTYFSIRMKNHLLLHRNSISGRVKRRKRFRIYFEEKSPLFARLLQKACVCTLQINFLPARTPSKPIIYKRNVGIRTRPGTKSSFRPSFLTRGPRFPSRAPCFLQQPQRFQLRRCPNSKHSLRMLTSTTEAHLENTLSSSHIVQACAAQAAANLPFQSLHYQRRYPTQDLPPCRTSKQGP